MTNDDPEGDPKGGPEDEFLVVDNGYRSSKSPNARVYHHLVSRSACVTRTSLSCLIGSNDGSSPPNLDYIYQR